MTATPEFSKVVSSIGKDFLAFSKKMGDGLFMEVHVERFNDDVVIKLTHGDCETPIVNAYAKNLKKRFGFITDGEGEEFAVDLMVPVSRLRDLVDALENSKKKLAKEFNTVVFTGTLTVSRAEAVKAAEKAGFKVGKSVTKKTDYLVVGDNPGTKEDTARDLGVKVLTEPQWVRLLKKSAPK